MGQGTAADGSASGTAGKGAGGRARFWCWMTSVELIINRKEDY